MTFQEPTPDRLLALSGWALSKKRDASDQQALALNKFQDGCETLAECCPATTIQRSYPEHTPQVAMPLPSEEDLVIVGSRQGTRTIPKEVLALTGQVVQQSGECNHRFNIHTQRCMYCGQTYLQAKGRRPELM